MTKIEVIKSMPTVIDRVHESAYRSHHILSIVLEMIERGDSKETIFDLVEYLRDHPKEKNNICCG